MDEVNHTITDLELANLLWNTISMNALFDEKLRPILSVIQDECKKLIGYTIIKSN
jgi:hypothetical protein